MPCRTLPAGVYRSGRSYRYSIPLSPDPTTGKRRWDTKSGFATPDEALKAKIKRELELERGERANPTRDTLAAWLDRWLPAHARAVSGGSQGNYLAWSRCYIKPHLGAVPLRELTILRVQTWHADLLAGKSRTLTSPSGRTQTISRPIKPSTIMGAHTVLVMALDAAIANGHLAVNVASQAGGLYVEPSERPRWDEATTRRFLAAAGDDPLYALWQLAVSSGLRISELLALRWQDLDLKDGFVSVLRTRTVTASGQVTVGPPKSRRSRVVAIDGSCVAVLQAHKRRQNEARLRAGRLWQDLDLVFPNDHGAMRSYAGARTHLAKLCRTLGVPVLSPHGLRHTHGSILGAAGVPLPEIASRLGHKHLSTAEIYVKPLPSLQREAVERFKARLHDTPEESPVAESVERER